MGAWLVGGQSATGAFDPSLHLSCTCPLRGGKGNRIIAAHESHCGRVRAPEGREGFHRVHRGGRSESGGDAAIGAGVRQAGWDALELGVPFSDPLAESFNRRKRRKWRENLRSV